MLVDFVGFPALHVPVPTPIPDDNVISSKLLQALQILREDKNNIAILGNIILRKNIEVIKRSIAFCQEVVTLA